jgi:antitoxin (DNA-binding transcriptional repressor) of toxin-antitoxin stability system
METIRATELKNRLGAVLKRAALGPVAIERHGRIVACLVPPPAVKAPAGGARAARGAKPRWTRRDEERVVELCAGGDFRPSRWLRAGDPRLLAGIAVTLASQEGFDRARLLALAERLQPGMSTPEAFGRWLARAPVQAARFLPLVRARLRARGSGARP